MSDIISQKQESELDTKLGKIKVKVPSLPKRLDIERRRTMYAGGFNVLSGLGVDLAEMFAFLDVVMVECDKLQRKQADGSSWGYDALSEFDFDLLQDAYEKANEWLDSFRKRISEE